MRKTFFLLITSILLINPLNLISQEIHSTGEELRGLADTIGFASYSWQMDTIFLRINTLYADTIQAIEKTQKLNKKTTFKVLVSPHDDYTYAGYMYPLGNNHIKAKTIFLIGVGHKARHFDLDNHIVFDSFKYWRGPYGKIPVSQYREAIMGKLPLNEYLVSDSMQAVEHSIEAILPFLQHNNSDMEIVPIVVPYMTWKMMKQISRSLAKNIFSLADSLKWKWGEDYAIVISTDAVHYGDKDWGGENLAPYGADSTGYKKAVAHEHEIINDCFSGELTEQKILKFNLLTVTPDNYKKYRWTWCGRYSVPFGLLTAVYLNNLYGKKPLKNQLTHYCNSIDHPHLKVDDIGMGQTAPANIHHWVGYAVIGF
ncbi:MAG: AmmeMemoRadiSam system protein B [Bacteroidales bacterium]|nr:AmmeMemoRadiSam system protein B [Bacteroidales bacterium]